MHERMELEGKSRHELLNIIDRLERQLSEMKDRSDRVASSEEALRLDEARLEALLKLTLMADASEPEIADFALEEAVRLTRSEVGWMGALNEDDTVVLLYNFSSEARKECEVTGKPHSFIVKDGGVWAEPIFTKKPIILNDYPAPHYRKKGFPEGHIPLKRFLAIPVFDGPRVVAVAEVGNKNTDYDRSDVRQLTLLMSGVWRIILNKRAKDALMESKSQAELYVDLMGHDINNMNQVALGFLELAIEKLDKDGKLETADRYLLEKPIDTLNNSARLIKNVKKLQSAREGGLKRRMVDACAMLASVVGEYSDIPGRDITIHYTPSEGCYVMANDLLRDVFSNIVGNSVKHSPADRTLEIWVSVLKVRAEGVDHYTIFFEDNGPGISDMKKAEIFGRLEKKSRRSIISGLGLGLVKTLVDDYGGKVWAEDRVRGDYTQGTRFVVMLPAAR
ncbi:sensor histidine kinase [Methanocella paludicola]|nr:GAF domain-containing sensor histidine kinase [Methanocella paludicola]